MNRVFLCLFALLFTCSVNAQDIDYAKAVIDILTSPEMHGRGYVEQGELKAATFIADEFQAMGLMPYTDKFFFDFTLDVNTFPGKLKVKIGEDELIPGADYLIHPKSGSGNGTFTQLRLKPAHLKNFNKLIKISTKIQKEKILVVVTSDFDKQELQELRFVLSRLNALNTGGIIEVVDHKLTWSVADTSYGFPYLQIKSTAFDLKAKQVELSFENKFIENYATQNVVGLLQGTESIDTFIIFSGHYDHLGMLGDEVYFPGANDDASGIAMMLNLAKYYSSIDAPQKYSYLFIAFGAEEAGLVGSKAMTDSAYIPFSRIKFMINMDIVGTGEDGIMVVNGKVFEEAYQMMVDINNEEKYVPVIKARGKAMNSDHYFFTENGVPSFFIYTLGGIAAYHDIYDRPETLPLTEFEDIFRLLTKFVEKL